MDLQQCAPGGHVDAHRKDSFQVWKVTHWHTDIPEGSLEGEWLWRQQCRGGHSPDTFLESAWRHQRPRREVPSTSKRAGCLGPAGKPRAQLASDTDLPPRSRGYGRVPAGRTRALRQAVRAGGEGFWRALLSGRHYRIWAADHHFFTQGAPSTAPRVREPSPQRTDVAEKDRATEAGLYTRTRVLTRSPVGPH